MRTLNLISLFSLSLLGGCVHIQKGVDTVCDKVAMADHLTAQAITVAPEEGVPEVYVDRYLVPVGQVVIEAHDFCFKEPEKKP